MIQPELDNSTDAPLAARLRPRSLDDVVGQEHILAPGRLLRRAIEIDQLRSLVFSGPPGTGKTTLASVIAEHTQSQFLKLNAVLSGVKDVREAITKAQSFKSQYNRRTILFVDEVHRWNRSQQDALLPWVENGTIIMIGATTENPFFSVNKALLSRSRVFILRSLDEDAMNRILERALTDRNLGYGTLAVEITDEARRHLIRTASGDARTLLNALELAVESSRGHQPASGEPVVVDLSVAEDSIQQRAVLYDKDGDYHFDAVSAFIKSVRGSDPDAALYWLAKMVHSGEDPRFIFRRLLILASEDIGLADPQAIAVTQACADAFERVGMPEGQYHLAEATLYLSNTHKSNSAMAYFDALAAVESETRDNVPVHLRDANRDGAALGHGSDYKYPHAYQNHWVAQQYLPEALQGQMFYQPSEQGWESAIQDILNQRRELQLTQSVFQEETWVAPGNTAASDRWWKRAEQAANLPDHAFRQWVVSALRLSEISRVALAGANIESFVFEIGRYVHGGSVRVIPTQRQEQVIRKLGQALPEDIRPRLERPDQISTGDPVDRFVLSLAPDALLQSRSGSAPGSASGSAMDEAFGTTVPLKECTHALADRHSRIVLIVPDPLKSTRLSGFAGDNSLISTLPEKEASTWLAVSAFCERVTEQYGLALEQRMENCFDYQRTIRSSDIDRWLSPGSPLGHQLTADQRQEVRQELVRRLTSEPVKWKRCWSVLILSVT